MDHTPASVDAELDLFELVATLLRRWTLIATFFLVGVIAAVVANGIITPVYRSEGSFSLRVDRTTGVGRVDLGVETYEALALSDIVLQGVEDAVGNGELSLQQWRESVFTVRLDSNRRTMDVSAVAHSPQDAQRMVEAWHASFVSIVSGLIEERIEQELFYLDRELMAVQEYGEAQLFEDVETASFEDANASVITELAVRGEVARRLLSLHPQQEQLQALSERLNTVELIPALIHPTFSEKPISPRKALNIAIAGFLGLFVGVGAALVLEAWNARNDAAKAASHLPTYPPGTESSGRSTRGVENHAAVPVAATLDEGN